MFGDIGLSELLVIALVVVLVTRPEDLPVLMRRLGIMTAHVQRFVHGIWSGWQEKLGL
jgi:Sec-independent protein translocase protein TatA